MSTSFTISPALFPQDLSTVTALFEAYTASLNLDLSFQSYSTELASLPGAYSPPAGRLYIAWSEEGEAWGCVALRPLTKSTVSECEGLVGEIKRLYVVPAARGKGVGRALAEKVLAGAREVGYEVVKLDTLGSMHAAIGMYKGLGFEECERYYDTPVQGTVFMRLRLEK
ncbi:acetyltransferase [Myriangium duriaei CBS 260.36]|uniref:Acetyltransferase n=1 Tax=Myriangium duriaei CBS 260.36 TaxID=1168546 RepID=A0A9P4MF88_9PEZI|nr:acetyltransferase [Myriangium duriaei CBS 260.36]